MIIVVSSNEDNYININNNNNNNNNGISNNNYKMYKLLMLQILFCYLNLHFGAVFANSPGIQNRNGCYGNSTNKKYLRVKF